MFTPSRILGATLALAALAMPCSAFAKNTNAPRESGFVMDPDGGYAFERVHERAGKLQRNFSTLTVAGVVQSNLLQGQEPEAAHVDHAAGVGNTTGHECAVNAGTLIRYSLMRELFLSADLRQALVRHSSSNRQNGGADYPTSGGVAFRGTFSHEQKNETGAMIVGGGLHF